MTNAEARFNKSLRPRKPEGSLGRTAQDIHLDSHTAPELCKSFESRRTLFILPGVDASHVYVRARALKGPLNIDFKS